MYRKEYKKGYFFVSASERLYYVSIDLPKYVIVDIDSCVIMDFRLNRKLSINEISNIIRCMEVLGRHELMKIELEEVLGATEVRVYRYEPRKVKTSEEKGGRHLSEEISVR
jgi:hypothetical protein